MLNNNGHMEGGVEGQNSHLQAIHNKTAITETSIMGDDSFESVDHFICKNVYMAQ